MNSKHFKTTKELCGFVIGASVIQICIILIAVFVAIDSKIVPKNELKTADIIITHTEYRDGFKHVKPKFCVFANNQEFVFKNNSWAEYSCAQLNSSLFSGDELSISYYEKATLFGTENIVIDARFGEMVYRSYESYAESDPLVAVIGLAFVFELYFIIAVYFKLHF